MSTIAIGCDHAGVALKAKLVEFLKGRGCEVLDVLSRCARRCWRGRPSAVCCCAPPASA